MDSDLVYLDGGNTYYFLWHLKKTGLFRLLQDYVSEGGVLAGCSAGGIIMTPDIRTAGFPNFDKDDNYVGLRDTEGLGVVGFEFSIFFLQLPSRLFVHYSSSEAQCQALLPFLIK